MRALTYLKCPLCGANVDSDGKSVFCAGVRRHLFDVASSGYVNLLPPGKGKNARTGDDKSMVRARADFLSGGYYDRFSRRIGEIISTYAENREIAYADCASGEGHHTLNIFKTLVENGASPVAIGIEASKYGAAIGAKGARRLGVDSSVFFAAGNIFKLPVKDSCLDFALSIFAPVAWDEMSRVLKDDGCLIVASSGERHLFELRRALYDEPRTAGGKVNYPETFSPRSEETVEYTAHVEGEDVKNLFYMTPFCYKTSVADAEKLSKIQSLDITVEVKLTVFAKTRGGISR